MIQDVAPPKRPRLKPKTAPVPNVASEPVIIQPESKEKPIFQTPEAVAKAEEQEALSSLGDNSPGAQSETVYEAEHDKEPKDSKPKRKLWRPSKWWQWLIVALVVLLLAGGGFAAWWFHFRSAPTIIVKKSIVKATIKPKLIYSNLSGLPIADTSLNNKPVTAVMIENSTDARPQSGLSEAGVVFEAIAEGGVTRFMALFQDTAPTNIGPVRSARPYYVQWALGFDAAYGHAGGSPDALSDIKAWKVQDMNLLNYSNYAHRTSRPSPHNLYSGVDQLNQLEQKQDYSSTFTGFPRTAKETKVVPATATSIDFALSSASYNPHYDYDPTTNTYKRSIAGVAQTDANTSQQLTPKVVIGIVVPLGRGELDASGAYYSDYNVLGSGKAYVFQDGGYTVCEWHKASNTDMITFTDDTGKPIPLERGQAWITAISATNQVKYAAPAAATP